MSLEIAVMDNVHVLTPIHNLAGGDETEELKAVVGTLSTAGVCRVVVDLGKISWVSSLGISGLIRARKTCIDRGGWLRLARAGDRIDNVILTSQLTTLFDTFDTIEEAVGAPVKTVQQG